MGLVAAVAVAATTSVVHAQRAALDRAALLTLADNYFAALVAHDTSRVALASDVKIWGGQIHEIEAVGITVDYNSPTGWE